MLRLRSAAVLLVSAVGIAQELPTGTVVPVMLDSALNAKKDCPGKVINGKVMQRVPLSPTSYISKGSLIRGHVVSIRTPGSLGARIVIKFDAIQAIGFKIPVSAALLALASTQRTWLDGSTKPVRLTPNPEAGCPAGPGYDREQAVWIFSSAACGIYHFGKLRIESSGSKSPIGEIVLISNGNVNIHRGSAWLLIAVPEMVPHEYSFAH